jgi:hypothetical protein
MRSGHENVGHWSFQVKRSNGIGLLGQVSR